MNDEEKFYSFPLNYIERPMYRDGEVVQFGDEICDSEGLVDHTITVDQIIYERHGIVLFDCDKKEGFFYKFYQRVVRPSDKDLPDEVRNSRPLFSWERRRDERFGRTL